MKLHWELRVGSNFSSKCYSIVSYKQKNVYTGNGKTTIVKMCNAANYNCNKVLFHRPTGEKFKLALKKFLLEFLSGW
jgi:hypothetical protein